MENVAWMSTKLSIFEFQYILSSTFGNDPEKNYYDKNQWSISMGYHNKEATQWIHCIASLMKYHKSSYWTHIILNVFYTFANLGPDGISSRNATNLVLCGLLL